MSVSLPSSVSEMLLLELNSLLHPLKKKSLQMKVEVTLLKCGAVGATGSLILEPFMYFQIWQGNFNVIKDGFDLKCRSRAEKIFTGLTAGQQHVSSCQAQLPASTAAPWVGAVCSG